MMNKGWKGYKGYNKYKGMTMKGHWWKGYKGYKGEMKGKSSMKSKNMMKSIFRMNPMNKYYHGAMMTKKKQTWPMNNNNKGTMKYYRRPQYKTGN